MHVRLPAAGFDPELWPVQRPDSRIITSYGHGVTYNVFMERFPNIPWPKVPKTNQSIEIRSIVVLSLDISLSNAGNKIHTRCL